MFRLSIVFILAALAVPAAALAKGPSQASISGPGFSKTVKVLYDGGGGSAGDNLTQASGFFPAAYGQSPDPLLQGRPTGPLGPRYTIAWRVPGGGSTPYRIRQDLYPYARGGAITYMKPGQPIFGMGTRGGWYRDAGLKRTLVSLGLAATGPSNSSDGNWTLVGALAAFGAVAAAVFVLWRRQRGQRSPLPASPA